MPQFNPGEERVAIATFPTKPAGLACTAELWLASDMTKVATSDGIPFTATGDDQSISLPIALPDVEGTYHVYLYVFSNGQCIARFLGDEDVEIAIQEPPLPPPGTGMPTDAEIEAVKATVRYRLDHLWFDPCAGIYPPGGNEAVSEAVKPIRDLQARVNAEMVRIQAEEKKAVAKWYAEHDRLHAILEQFGALNRDLFEERSGGCGVDLDTGEIAYYFRWEGRRFCQAPSRFRFLHPGEPLPFPDRTVWDYLTTEERALVEEWNAKWMKSYLDPVRSFFSWDAYNAAKAAFAQAQTVGREYQARWKPLIRLHDELRMDYWYCGIPLGY